MDDQMCFDCLQRRIQEDFSGKLIFSYGISDSAFPFGSTAIVQMPYSTEEVSSPQFILEYLPARAYDCLTKYVNEHFLEDLEANHSNEAISTQLVINQDQMGGKKTSLAVLGCKCSSCKFSGRFSCLRTIAALAPIAQIGISSCNVLEELASDFLSVSAEDHILCGLCLLIEGKATSRDSINFLNTIGIPSVDENSFPGCLRHPNIAPILGMLKGSNYINLILPKSPYTLQNILYYSPNALKSDWHIRFLVYQLLSALAFMHGLGVSHGNVCPSNVMLTESCWSWLPIGTKQQQKSYSSLEHKKCSVIPPSRIACCTESCPSEGLFVDLKLAHYVDWHSTFYCWWKGELSNFEYLIILNKLAGRRWGDHRFHMVMPWVIDFSVKTDENNDAGWRDLTRSKWHLAKGDEQLDFTYSTSEMPHHVSDECLSELAVCSYKARRLPLSVLRMAVRSVYEPNEYPSTMQRLYQWTPDECIPEFYCDSQIFSSLHSGMSDLAVPSWAGSPEEFIKLHRDALESHHVSCQIHHWIDITFGYKMSGQAAIDAKNVMLPSSASTVPRSMGRRQLFTQPHPARQGICMKTDNGNSGSTLHCKTNEDDSGQSFLFETAHLQELEKVAAFCAHASHLSPIYSCHLKDYVNNDISFKELPSKCLEENTHRTADFGGYSGVPQVINSNYLLEKIEVDSESYMGYQELLLWRHKASCSKIFSEDLANDIFSIGCILAELHLKRPLFDPISFAVYLDSGVPPRLMHELPFHAKVLVEECIQRDWSRRPSAKCLLESPYFPATVRSSYLFLAPLQLLAKDGSRLCYAANFAKQGALRSLGTFATEMCAPYCLPLVLPNLSDIEAEWGYILLKEFLKCLSPTAVKALVVPAIQKILQATGYSHLKVSLLQDSFVQEVWNQIGKQTYLETIHPLVISNLYVAPHRSSAAAASVLLIGSSEELGAPITVHQTILPLIQCFGKGLCNDGIDVIIRIGGLFGESFIVKQILPLLRNVIRSCIDVLYVNKSEPLQNWSAFAIRDCLITLDSFIPLLPRDVVVKELIDGSLHVQVLMQMNLGIPVLQVAATSLISVCQQIGPDLTALHVLPKLKGLFDELAFSQVSASSSCYLDKSLKASRPKVDENDQLECRMDLVLLLYPYFASLLGIEKLRQCCATWLLLEQLLLRRHNWKWECTGESSQTSPENINARRPSFSKGSTSEYDPAKLLLNGVGWSIPQSQGNGGLKNLAPHKRIRYHNQNQVERHATTPNFGHYAPWYWFPSPASSWDGPDFLSRVGNKKDEIPWKIRASIIHSVRAHHGAVRSFAVCQDERTVFTAGVSAGFKGTVQKWELSRVDCVSGYYGHDEVVNDICILASSDRVASCDGTLHIWNSQTGKLVSVFAEFSANSVNLPSPLASAVKLNSDQANMLNYNPLSSGILTTAFDGSLYTSMHYLEFNSVLIMGTGNGSLRFIDVAQGQKLHLWRSEYVESSFPSLISSICSCGSDKMQNDGPSSSPSWIAAGLSSGNCRLLDMRSGNIIASWQAHDGYVTKLAAPQDHLLVSSSLDKTLRIWDLRRNWASQPIVMRGHNDSVSGFSIWGQDMISISRNKIGLSSLSSSGEDGQHRVIPQYLYMADHELRNMSVLSSISILPFSRLFLVGTEDGFLKLCN